MTRNPTFTGLLLILLLCTAFAATPSVYAAQSEQTKAEVFIKIANNARDQALRLKTLAVKEGVSVSELSNAETLISQGEADLSVAENAIQATPPDYNTVYEKARAAQVEFREAMIAIGESMEALGDTHTDAEKGQGILTTINRERERIRRIRVVLTGLTGAPSELVAEVNANLTLAEEALDAAEAAIQPGNDLSLAESKHEEGVHYINEAFRALKSISDWTMAWRSQNYLNGLNKRLEKARDRVNKLAQKGVNVQDLEAKLSDVEALIQEAESKISAGDKGSAMNDMKNAKDLLYDIEKDLHDIEKDLAK